MNSHTLFLKYGVIGNKVDMQTSRQCNRSERTVRRKGHVIGFCHSGNFVAFGNTACMREIWLQNRNTARLQHAFKIEA